MPPPPPLPNRGYITAFGSGNFLNRAAEILATPLLGGPTSFCRSDFVVFSRPFMENTILRKAPGLIAPLFRPSCPPTPTKMFVSKPCGAITYVFHFPVSPKFLIKNFKTQKNEAKKASLSTTASFITA